MNLTELQIELRDIEERISKLHQEVENMKPQTEGEKKTNFKMITRLAKGYPIEELNISNAPELLQREFVISLSYLFIEEKDIYSRLLYLTRIALGCKLDISSEYIYRAGIEFDIADINKVCDELIDYKYNYLVEAFILANLSGETSERMFNMITYIAEIMGCDKNEVYVISQVAKSKLINNVKLIEDITIQPKNSWNGKFKGYISSKRLATKRIKCASIRTELNEHTSGFWEPCRVVDKLNVGDIVEEGQVILRYEEEQEEMRFRDTPIKQVVVKAPHDGMVFYIETYKDIKVIESYTDYLEDLRELTDVGQLVDKYLEVYVVSYFDDYTDFCNWHKNIQEN